MAIRKNASLPNRHTGYIACSGYGKSQALKQNKDIPAKGARVLLWDTDEDHKCSHFEDKLRFVRAVVAGMSSGRGFRIGWSGQIDVETFEWWSRIVWNCLDGKVPLYIIIEELADVQPSVGKASPVFGQVCRKARKYNGILHWTSQRSEEISKTVFSQTPSYYMGFPNDTCTPLKAKELARIARCPNGAVDLYALQPLQFFHKTALSSKLVALQYKKL